MYIYKEQLISLKKTLASYSYTEFSLVFPDSPAKEIITKPFFSGRREQK